MSEYVTVVSVDLQPKCQQLNGGNSINSGVAINSIINELEKKSSFVTVLSINNNQNTTTISTLENPTNGEIVTVYRLPGERLGFGLKFQGGTKTNERVERLFIQSCDPDSPASRARASWGGLSEGDEILQIDNEPITKMTRIECVKCLKDRNVAINLLVKKGDRNSMMVIRNDSFNGTSKRPVPPSPPKIPPRKINNKKPMPASFRDTNSLPIASPKATINVQQQQVQPVITETPVAAESYLNCTLDDDLSRNDESDETGSTISSQISVISNFSSESDLSLLSSNASNSDLTRILTKPFQMIEREFNVNSTNVVSSNAPMSIDNLLLFNESEPSEFNIVSNNSHSHNHNECERVNDDIKVAGNYVNISSKAATSSMHVSDDQRQYENVDMKLPPVPRPRSISLPQEVHCEIDTKSTPTKTTIESWLNDAKAVNGNDADKIISTDEHEQSYEPIKFECFAAGDDEDEKLGPPEFLNISQAYFNFPWCGNSTSSLPTIGEAEEEFSSMEQFVMQKSVNGPILIVHDTDDKNGNGISEAMDIYQHKVNMEINNNNDDNDSSYLHTKSEDKSDNLIVTKSNEHMHNKIESDKDICSVRIEVKSSVVSEKIPSVFENNKISKLNHRRDKNMELQSDNDKCDAKLPNEHAMTQVNENSETIFNRNSNNESAECLINNKVMMINNDSERLNLTKEICAKSNCTTPLASQRISSFIDDDVGDRIACNMTQSNDMKTEPKEQSTTKTNSNTSSSVHNNIAQEDAKMEQKHLSFDQKIDTAKTVEDTSSSQADGSEAAMSRATINSNKNSHKFESTTESNKFSPTPITSSATPIITKATAIVAPQRKTHNFEEITNFVDSKPPFKSATLGRQRPQLNWRNKDEKSEKSVKDKIAMFSNSTTDISHILPKSTPTNTMTMFRDKSSSYRGGNFAKSTENIFCSGNGSDSDSYSFRTRNNHTNGSNSSSSSSNNKINYSIKKKAMSVENLDDYDDDDDLVLRDNKRDNNGFMSYTPVSKPKSLLSPASPRPSLMLNMNRTMSVEHLNSSYDSPALPSRPPPSTAPILTRHISFNGGMQNEELRQKSIANLIENRKQRMSKLRGLVIPEKVPEGDLQVDQKVLGLPVIRSKECDLISSTPILVTKSASPSPSLSTRKTFGGRRMDFEYSGSVKPAPRKSLEDEKKISPPIKPPRTSLILSTQSKSLTSNATDESDTESCMSSRVSTPPISPVAKKPLIRTLSSNSSLSSNSTLTSGSGSQASCSSNGSGSPEIRKNSSESTATRKSIVASSKSRSGRECLEKSWRDEDSTDGGIDNEEKQRVPKAKARSSLTNYKVINSSDNIVDKKINVATYVEVLSSDSEDKIEPSESMSSISTQKTITQETISSKTETPNLLTDMAKWVRKEASKTTEVVKKIETTTMTTTTMTTEEIRKIPKSLETPKKLNLSEIRKNFENKQMSNGSATTPSSIASPRTPSKEKTSSNAFNHNRFSSWDSVASSSSGVSSELLGTGTGTNNSESLQTIQSDFGSFSSFGSSHSLITPQDLQSIIDEADPPLETSEAFVVVLHRESPESSIGITLAGGSDYEAKEITIHRILINSPADKDGRLKRGDRILSINGLSMRGLTHRESLSVLKSPRTDVVMVITRSKSIIKTNSLTKTKLGSLGSLSSLSEKADSIDSNSMRQKLHASRSVEMDLDALSNEDCKYTKRSQADTNGVKKETNFNSNDIDIVNIIKDGTGIGISLDGGYDSPLGNKPLVIKKVFMGGAAEKLSNVKAGDEILEINGKSVEKQTRIDVWNMIKKMPQGENVRMKIKRK